MKKLIIGLLPLGLAACGDPEGVQEYTGKASAFVVSAAINGVVFYDGIQREEAPALLSSAASVWGTNVPEDWRQVIVDTCAISATIETELDEESAAVCEVFMPGAVSSDDLP